MTWLEFGASIVSSIAWPLAIVSLALILRRPIKRLLKNLRMFRYGGIELEFQKILEKIETELPESLPVNQIPQPVPSDYQSLSFEELLNESPRAAVSSAWQEINKVLIEVAKGKEIEPSEWLSPENLALALASRGFIDPNTMNALTELRSFRNKVIHSPPDFQLTEIEARRYKKLVDLIASEIRAKNAAS